MPDANLTLIRKNGGTVAAYDDAVVFHSAIGHDYSGQKRGVVLKGIGNEFVGYFPGGRSLRVQSGMGILYGRQFRIPDGQYVELTMPSAARKVLVYVEVKITANSEEVAVKAVSGSGPDDVPTIGDTDISKYATGTATMPLYIINWSGIGYLGHTDLREVREPGEAESARSMGADGTLDGTPVSSLVEANGTGYCIRAREAAHAATTERVNGQPISDKLEVGSSKACSIATFAVGTINDQSANISLNSGKTYYPCKVTGEIVGLLINGTVTGYRTDIGVYGFVPGAGLNFYLVDEDNIGNQNVSSISYKQGSAPVALVSCQRVTGGQYNGYLSVTVQSLINSIDTISLSITVMQKGVF